MLKNLQIQTKDQYGEFAKKFMAPPRVEEDETNSVIDRRSVSGQLIRYDQKLNLLGVLDLETGRIITFFRPGFLKGGPFSDTLEPNDDGEWVFRRFVANQENHAI